MLEISWKKMLSSGSENLLRFLLWFNIFINFHKRLQKSHLLLSNFIVPVQNKAFSYFESNDGSWQMGMLFQFSLWKTWNHTNIKCEQACIFSVYAICHSIHTLMIKVNKTAVLQDISSHCERSLFYLTLFNKELNDQ